jgi:hypothetical protein
MDPDVKQAMNNAFGASLLVHQNANQLDNRIISGVLTSTLIGSNAMDLNTANQTPHANDVPAPSK